MPTFMISLPDDIKTIAEADASKAGQTLEEYVTHLIIAHVDQPVSDEVEAELLKGLASPGRAFSAAAWEERRRGLEHRHGRGK